MRVDIDRLEFFMYRLLIGAGLNENNATNVANVYRRATLRDVGHHDINDLPKRLKALHEESVKANPKMERTENYQAMENYNGDNGLGELCAHFIMNRSKELANIYGISLCSVFNSNHFLSAQPYVEESAEDGYLSIIYSSTQPVMGWPNSKEKVIGNNPMGFGVTGKRSSIILDISMAYFSVGGLLSAEESNKELPKYTAVNELGDYTSNPSEALRGGSLPIGKHKGFGLAILGELLTSVLNGGTTIEEKSKMKELFGEHLHTQTIITIKQDGFINQETYKERVDQLQEFIKNKDRSIRLPGERSLSNKARIEQNGILIKEDLKIELNHWARIFNMQDRI
ncbi:Ldh family oxidoreductase [Oceanobacillus jeddahense]|uniref:Ldh family oxidoreductase n=1 Tax=Oceanobacillus jeddahense TaxID=1462527 RepID=UPI000595897C|nr:Ldh family oxidoreductase [Oceanobacillus jeddahense]